LNLTGKIKKIKFLQRDESEKLKFKNLNIKNFKLQSENKSLYEFLSKTQFQCNESSVLQKFKDLENYFQNSEQVNFIQN